MRLLRIGNVEYIVLLSSPVSFGPPLYEIKSVFTEPIRVWKINGALPRTYVVAGTRIADEPRSYSILLNPSFDPFREIILPSGTAREARGGFVGTSRVVSWKADALSLRVEADEPGYVVVVEGYDRGWRARVDGKETRVERANVLFRAVRVPAGTHDVEMYYRPPEIIIGALSTIMASIFGVFFILRMLIRSQKAEVAAAR
ncbi:MAG: YfhO family protein [Vicinamibacteria bacterium]|nr:YfhO family protein [Vicinamibacteria bacterium]